ncbi:MAG: sirohydrochlorin cobaltochelatase [Bacteroidaceae bacterium]|nr:sirohydrochlorin cobaltochelatase [Bacteroidaceae bacterium]
MKTIKFLMMAAVALMTAMSFSACSDDDDNSSNYQKYQQEVTNMVNSQKKHDKVILIVAFGSTWGQAYDTFATVVDDYKTNFPDWDVYLSFSSIECINNARAGENEDPKSYYDPEHWLNAIGQAKYKQIVVQSLQVIPGEEYRNVRDSYVKNFMNNKNGIFTTEYLKSLDRNVVIGTPLMAEESDAEALATVLNDEEDIQAAVAEGIVAFMGHGNPEGYDYYGGNIRYVQLEQYLRAINENYYVGTVDMEQTLVDDVLENIAGRTVTYEVGAISMEVTYPANTATKAQLYPLMSIAGDHAHNDMADEGDEESWFSMFNAAGIETAAYETNFAEPCWLKYINGETDDDGYIPALAERAAVRQLWMNHTQDAIDKLGTEYALSTPTTAPDEE